MAVKYNRFYVEKKKQYAVEARHLMNDIKRLLEIESIVDFRIINRYDFTQVDGKYLDNIVNTILSEPNVDDVSEELNVDGYRIFAMEYLPGQYDQRADQASQCIQILTKEKPTLKTAKIIAIKGELTDKEFESIKKYTINPVDSREASINGFESLNEKYDVPNKVEIIDGFINMDEQQLSDYRNDMGFAMSFDDIKMCHSYFRDTEKRNPSITELKVIDTYWSDHCRHTTFETKIEEVNFEESEYSKPIIDAYNEYLKSRKRVYTDRVKDVCLMDIATLAMKELRKDGQLDKMDVSQEINACSVVVNANVNEKDEEWLVMFKNETHNHPTEIEPFGGAATCLGGAIRDPLSGRAYVYQAMRVTGASDPTQSIDKTIAGKLPQRKICSEAASGYSSYGNQIGLATGEVTEYYNKGYIAKRMEIGAVVGAVKKENVVREVPQNTDVVLLVGGKTGRDGCGGATGSSKAHTEESLLNCGAEVQKGNAPEERKIQRLFRNPEVSRMIIRCNDFGAGGVCVAVGELADGLDINLDNVTKKYEGLDATELAISESQERMAVVVKKENKDKFIELAEHENLQANVIAKVTDDRRLKMSWNGDLILDISRDFLDTNGAKQKTSVIVTAPKKENDYFKEEKNIKPITKEKWLDNLRKLNVASQKGLVEKFDSTVGAGSILMPFGGKYQLTPTIGMAAKLPVLAQTNTCTIMTHGFNPKIASFSPFHGGIYAALESIIKAVLMGANYDEIYLSFQEYFERLDKDASKWGKPFSALLGGFLVQKSLKKAAIGGKDSMSGTFKDIHVPPTLVSFALGIGNSSNVVSSELKKTTSKVVLIRLSRDEMSVPNFDKVDEMLHKMSRLIRDKKILASSIVKFGGVAATISKMAFGNKIGVKFMDDIEYDIFSNDDCSIVVEIDENEDLNQLLNGLDYVVLASTNNEEMIKIQNVNITMNEAIDAWKEKLDDVYKIKEDSNGEISNIKYTKGNKIKSSLKIAKPRVFIPVFPGTNCEYDTQAAFNKAGGNTNLTIFKNMTSNDINSSIEEFIKIINESQIIALPGGFSAGDEPEGSGKFISTIFRNPKIKEAVMNMLYKRDGLMLGICNGFQALIKLGLVPYGEIRDIDKNSPTLTFNKIGRHISCMAMTKVTSNLSPWFNNVKVGDVHNVPISHGEGRFVAKPEMFRRLIDNGQVATQYVDHNSNASYDGEFNPNGSFFGVEAITSPDGRILGKMGHSERVGTDIGKNVTGEKNQKIFEAGINYFG